MSATTYMYVRKSFCVTLQETAGFLTVYTENYFTTQESVHKCLSLPVAVKIA